MFEDPVHGENESERDVEEGGQESDSGYVSDLSTGYLFIDDPPGPGTELARAAFFWAMEREQLCRLRQHIGTHIWLGKTAHFWPGKTRFETVIKPLIVQADEANTLLRDFRSSAYCPEAARVSVFEEMESVELSTEDETRLVANVQAVTNVISDVMEDWNRQEYSKLQKEAPARLLEFKERNSELRAAFANVGYAAEESTTTHISDADMMNTAVGRADEKGRLDGLYPWLQRLWTESDKVKEVKLKVLPMLTSKARSVYAGLRGGGKLRDADPNDSAAAVIDSPSSGRTVELDEHGEEFLPVPGPGEWYRSSRRPRVSARHTDPTF